MSTETKADKAETKAEAKAEAKTPAAEVSKTPLSPQEVKERELALGKKALLKAAHGRMVHPDQVPLDFDTDRVTIVVVDRWVQIQYGAGKLVQADDE